MPTSPAEVAPTPVTPAALLSTCAQGTFTQFDARQWACGEQVDFYTSVSSLSSPLQTAVGEWRARLDETGFADVPTFQTTTVPGFADATATGTGIGAAFCGTWAEGSRTLNVTAYANCGANVSSGPLHNLLLHEVGHAVGWLGQNTHKFFRTAAAGHCVMHLPEDLTINGALCAHEVEGVLAGYGLVNHPAVDFEDTPFVTGSASPLLPQSLEVGATAQLSPGALALELGGVVPGTATAYSWTSSASGVATVSSSGLVTAVAPGSTVIRALPVGGSGYLLAHPFRIEGRTATITVLSAPPAPAFQVDSIGADQMPITTAGYRLFTARVLSQPTGSLTTEWIITDSRTPSVSDTLTVSGNTLSRYVAPGAYTLSLTVRPSVGGTAGFAATQGIPVCAEASTDLWGGGGGSTNAVPGCEGAQQ